MPANILDIPNQLALFSTIRINDYIDILIIAYIIYKVATFFKNTRSVQVLKGIVILIVSLQLSEIFKLNTVNYILKNAIQVGFIAVIILFQPELRSALSKMGRSKVSLFNFDEDLEKAQTLSTIKAISQSAKILSEKKIGALIVIERNTKIMDIVRTGIMLDSVVSCELLNNIFYPKAPLHDGAVVISNNKVKAAGCFLPLSQNDTLDSELGTRHRAGLGISETSDCIVVIVSEETGKISLACDGGLTRNLSAPVLEEALKNLLIKDGATISKTRFKLKIKQNKKQEKASKKETKKDSKK